MKIRQPNRLNSCSPLFESSQEDTDQIEKQESSSIVHSTQEQSQLNPFDTRQMLPTAQNSDPQKAEYENFVIGIKNPSFLEINLLRKRIYDDNCKIKRMEFKKILQRIVAKEATKLGIEFKVKTTEKSESIIQRATENWFVDVMKDSQKVAFSSKKERVALSHLMAAVEIRKNLQPWFFS